MTFASLPGNVTVGMGITDTTTLQAASVLCGQWRWKVRGQDHRTLHDVASPDMIRQLPAGFAVVIRGGSAPVIARLPRQQREVIELCVYAGLDQQAAALSLGISVSNVKSRLHRARQRLASELRSAQPGSAADHREEL